MKNNLEAQKINKLENKTQKSLSTLKKEKYDDYHKNQNIMSRKKNIINISTLKIQKKQECVFSYDA